MKLGQLGFIEIGASGHHVNLGRVDAIVVDYRIGGPLAHADHGTGLAVGMTFPLQNLLAVGRG